MRRIFILLFIVMTRSTVWADDGPVVRNDGAFGPMAYPLSLKEKSIIRMEKEHLVFNFNSDYTTVKATFIFKNTDQQHSVTQLTGFPDVALGQQKAQALGKNPGSYYHTGVTDSVLENLETFLDGKKVPSDLEYGYVSNADWAPGTQDDGDYIAWYVIQMVFPPGGRKILERHYKCSNGGRDCPTFTYIVHTGGGWHGTIGELKADVILDKGVLVDNVDLDPPSGWWEQTGKNSYSTDWKDFDPRVNSLEQKIEITDCPKRK
jgi:hypothetical protein